MRLALKVDVDTLRGTREGVPALVEIFRRHGVGATFLFSMGPDHTGRAIKRVFRPGFVGKVRRTSVVEHYGVRTLMYGTLLPGPDIGKRAGDVMRMTRDEGFETGIHCWDHVRWQDGLATADAAWTAREMRLAVERYTDVFKEPPRTHGAAGWQMNVHALRMTQRLGFEYCSDGRGDYPHLPFWNAEPIRCPQFPTTLPTLDETLAWPGLRGDAAQREIFRTAPRGTEVHTIHAEVEGRSKAALFASILDDWLAAGVTFPLLSELADEALGQRARIPVREVVKTRLPGRGGTVATGWPGSTVRS